MDKNLLLSKLNNKASGVDLRVAYFGRTQRILVETSSEAIMSIARLLKADPDFRFDHLENLVVSQKGEILVFSYFLTSSSPSDHGSEENEMILRFNTLCGGGREWVSVPSLRDVWPVAEVFESELAELFGILFLGQNPNKIKKILPKQIKGFPLRKSFQLSKLGAPSSQSDREVHL